MKVLPHMDGTVILLDSTDTAVLCSGDELQARIAALLPNKDDEVGVAGEFQIWPRNLEYHGKILEHPWSRYPGPPRHTRGSKVALRFVNVGLMVGRPRTIVRMLRCLIRRYGFPNSCPSDINRNGSFTMYGRRILTRRPLP